MTCSKGHKLDCDALRSNREGDLHLEIDRMETDNRTLRVQLTEVRSDRNAEVAGLRSQLTRLAGKITSQDEKKFRWKCFFGLHNYQPWSDPKPGTTEYPALDKKTDIRLQTRYCPNCNEQDSRQAV